MKTSTFLSRAFLTLTIALMSISGAMAANTNWSGSVSAGTSYDNVTLTGNTTLTVASGSTCTVTGNVTGSYKLTVTGGGTLKLLGTANAWTGGLTVTNGIVKFGDDTHQGHYTSNTSATISIASGSNIDFYVTTTTSEGISSQITGSGTFWKYGTGALYWRGDVSGFTGTTTVSAGRLYVTNATTAYNSPTTVRANATLNFYNTTSSSTTIDVNKAISGDGNVRATTYQGEYIVNLKVANTYTGSTSIDNANTTNIVFLNVYNAGFASSSITFQAANTEFVWRAGQQTLDIPITGAGNVQKTGNTSTLTLKQASYTGYTSILDGTLIFTDCAPTGEINFHGETDASVNFAVSSGNTVTYANKIINGGKQILKSYPGTLKLTSDAHTYTGQTVIYLGTLELGGTSTAGDISSTSDVLVDGSTAVLRFTPGKDYTFNKKIWGQGKVEKHSNYKLILSYDNNYDGGTMVTLGSLCIGANSTAGSSTGSVGNGNVSVAAGCGLLFGRSGTSFTYGGVISGAGYIRQISTGKTTLTGANTFTGYASIERGTLALSGSGSIANSGGIWFTETDDGKFDISGVGSQCIIKSLQNDADTGDEVVLGSKQLVIGTTDGTDGSGDFAGKISGTGTLVKTGFGTLKLTGTSTYTGRTTIQQGVLEFSALASFGAASSKISLTDRGKTIRWLSGNTADISGKIDNINSTTGTTFDVGANSVTFATALPSSSGPLYKEGSGTLIFTADNASTSTFTVSAGVLQLGNGGANGMVANNLSISSGATVSFYMNSNKTYTGTITGSGQVDNWGQNNSSITFTKAVSNAGKFRAAAASNSIFNAAVTPNIEILSGTAFVTFDSGSNLTYSGVISGAYAAAKVFKKGSGTLTLNGANTTTASLVNESGTLKLSTDWKGSYAQEAGASLTVDGSRTVASLLLLGGTINFTYPSSKLNITGSASVGGTGTTTLNVSGVTGIVSNAVLMQAASGLATPDKFTLAVPGAPSGYTSSLDCSSTQVKLNVTAPTVPVSSITVSPTTLNLKVGGAKGKVTATIAPNNATDKSFTWSSDNTAIATVNSTGEVTAIKRGTCKIQATTPNGKQGECNVTVEQPVTAVNLSHTTIGLQVGGSQQLTASVSPADANNQYLDWSSSNTTVAIVNSTGLVEAKAVGTATITVASKENSSIKKTCQVTVTAATVPVTGVSISPTSLSLTEGQSASVTVTITPSNATNSNYSLVSSNSSVAEVNSSGTVIAKVAGSCKITVTTAEGNFKAECNVTVTAASSLSVTPTTLNFVAAGASQSFSITSNVSWTVASSASWLTVSPASGSNNGTVSATATANSSTSTRTATITVSGGGLTRTVSVSQAGTTPSSNNNLASLSLNGVSISPAFSPSVTNYSAWVSNSTTSVGVTATAEDGGATVTITGNTNLKVGSNTITITVKAANGSTRTYTITVTRDDGSGNEELTTTHIYAVGGTLYITLPAPETVQIYALTGKLVRNIAAPAGSSQVTLPGGVYIVKTPTTTVKVVL